MQLKVLPVAVLAVAAVSLAASAGPVDPAQAIAQKFYEASEPKPVAKPVVQPVANKVAASVAVPVTMPSPPGLDYEMDMLREARAEELARESADSKVGQTNVAQPLPTPAPPRAVAEAPTPPSSSAPQPSPEQAAPEPAASEPPAPKIPEAAAPEPPLQTAIKQESETSAPASAAGTALGPRATVLIVLDTDDDDAVPHMKPDPIICFDQQCWISNGLEAPAKPMPRSVALALKTTDNVTGDSCSGKAGCAFRDIALAPNAQIQVVEVGESRGVADGAYTVANDTTCRKNNGDLICDNALVTHAFRMWVVPETTALAIGPAGLEDAIANNLPDDADAPADDGK